MKVSDLYRWHIAAFDENRNKIEAYYIHFLIQFWSEELNKKYKTILDIPCGVGRHHSYLRKFGYEVYGVDISEELIKIAKNNNKSYENYYFIGDMRNFKLDKKVDIVLNWFTSFGYFDDEDNIKTIRNFYENMNKDGLLILEYTNYLTYPINQTIVFDYGNIIEISTLIPIDNKYVVFHDKYYKKDNNDLIFLEECKIKVRAYSLEDITKILEENNFKVLKVFRTLSFSNFNKLRDNRFTIVAKKI